MTLVAVLEPIHYGFMQKMKNSSTFAPKNILCHGLAKISHECMYFYQYYLLIDILSFFCQISIHPLQVLSNGKQFFTLIKMTLKLLSRDVFVFIFVFIRFDQMISGIFLITNHLVIRKSLFVEKKIFSPHTSNCLVI